MHMLTQTAGNTFVNARRVILAANEAQLNSLKGNSNAIDAVNNALASVDIAISALEATLKQFE